MKRVWPIVATIAALTAACLATTPALASAAQTPTTVTARNVTVVLAPYLTWADISPTSTPALWRLAGTGALASVNSRGHVIAPGGGAAPLEGALALSAGAWAIPDWSAPAAFDATETYGSGVAEDAYRSALGTGTAGARIAYIGLPMTAKANVSAAQDIVPGTLGQAVRDAGGLTAAIGNSDTGPDARGMEFQRPAGVAAMDRAGLVAAGDVSADMLATDSAAPFGRRTDLARFASELDQVDALAGARPGPSLVVLDPGDLVRAHYFARRVDPGVAAHQHADAVQALDAVVAMADAHRGADGVLIVASQALSAGTDGVSQGLGPLVIAGPGFSGYATSSSTHRAGTVTNLDITATALRVLGLARPVQVLGNPMTATAGPDSALARVEVLARFNNAFVAADAVRPAALRILVGLVVGVLAAAALLLLGRGRLPGGVVRAFAVAVRATLLLGLALPLAAWLALAIAPLPATLAAAWGSLAAVTGVLAGIALVASFRFPARVPVAALLLATSAAIVLDQLTGALLSLTNIFGYSPLIGARYYGMGNEAASVLLGATLVGIALVLDEWPASRVSAWLRAWGVAAAGAVAVVVSAAPGIGANVGVAIWGTVGFALLWMFANGRRLTWRRGLGIAALVVASIAVFSAIDLLGGGEQTHLGRALAGAANGGFGTIATIVARKVDANVRVLRSTNLTWMLAAALAFAGFVRWVRPGDWRAHLAENPAFASAALAAAGAGAVAFLSEDSGIAIPSLIAVYVGLVLAWLLLARVGRGGEAS